MPSGNRCKRVASEPAVCSAADSIKRVKRSWDPLNMSVSSTLAASSPAVEGATAHCPASPTPDEQDASAAAVVAAPADLPHITAKPPKPRAHTQHQPVQACTTPTTSDAVNVSFGVWAMPQGNGDGTPRGTASAEGSLQHWACAKDAADAPGNSNRLLTPGAGEVDWDCNDPHAFHDQEFEDTATSSTSDDSGSEGGSQGYQPGSLLATAASATQQALHVQLAPGEEDSLDSQRPLSTGQAFSFGGLEGPACLQPYWASSTCMGVKAK